MLIFYHLENNILCILLVLSVVYRNIQIFIILFFFYIDISSVGIHLFRNSQLAPPPQFIFLGAPFTIIYLCIIIIATACYIITHIRCCVDVLSGGRDGRVFRSSGNVYSLATVTLLLMISILLLLLLLLGSIIITLSSRHIC